MLTPVKYVSVKSCLLHRYTKMTDTVDHLFPPIENHPQYGQIHSGKFPAPDKYSNFTYWREPLPDIENELNMLLGKK